jgi:EAL domain-containing protein (putative c-di-GMP-specific phosphodiesterase class I)
MGLAYGPARPGEPEQTLSDARVAMNRATTTGGASTYDGAMRTEMVDRLRLEGDLSRALKNEEFHLEFQPIVDSDTGTVAILEALLRWVHPERGGIPPDDFIPAAEEGRQIVPIGAWVLQNACEQMAAWIAAGGEPVRIAVNVSPVQIWNGGFVQTVARVLRETGLDPALLELELTEQLFMGREHSIPDLLVQIKELGVSLAIDDFGTGYSSLAYLRRFPVDKLKIDKTFVDGLPHQREDIAIVQSVVSLSHALDMTVVAEGVETAEQVHALQNLGVDFLQGWHYGRPTTLEIAAMVGRPRLRVANVR